ncbi:MAG: hypothetical protein ACOC78_03960 [Actinomycetota bacterium]
MGIVQALGHRRAEDGAGAFALQAVVGLWLSVGSCSYVYVPGLTRLRRSRHRHRVAALRAAPALSRCRLP